MVQPASNENRILAALGYPIWIVALVVLLTDMKQNRFMRVHAIEALLSLGVVVVVGLSNPAGALTAASAVQDSLPYANLYTPDEIRQGFYNR